MSKNTEQKTPKKSILPEVVAVSILNKKMRATTAAALAAKVVADELIHNRQHYYDMIAFNFNNGITSNKVYDKIHFSDLPAEYRKQVSNLYSMFDEYTTAEIFDALGIVQTIKNSSSPIEAKFAYEYHRKYGSFDYDPSLKRIVTNDEVIRKLQKTEKDKYTRWF